MSITETPGVMSGASAQTAPSQAGQKSAKTKGSVVQDLGLGADDRRRFRRAIVPLLGRFMRENREEYPCQIVNASAGGLAVRAIVPVQTGERIVLYIDALGRIEGQVVRAYGDGFALRLNASEYKREKIANQLTWLVNREMLSSIEDRQHDRYVPKKSRNKISLQDGTALDCEVLDVSLGGAAVNVEPQPDIGELVTLGLIAGQVVRHGDGFIGIQFLEIQNPATIQRQFG